MTTIRSKRNLQPVTGAAALALTLIFSACWGEGGSNTAPTPSNGRSFGDVANQGTDEVAAYTIDANTGELTPIDADPLAGDIQNVPAGSTPFLVTADPSGKFVYVANLESAEVSTFAIDAGTGELTPIDADPVTGDTQNTPAEANHRAVAIMGRF